MISNFFVVSTSSITVQSLGEIVQRALAVGAKIWCLSLCFFYRQDAAKRQTAGIKFTHRPKIRFLAPQGRLVAPIQVKFCTADGHLGPLGCATCYLNRRRRVGMRPKNFHFLVKSRPAFGNFVGISRFIRPGCVVV